MLHLMKESLQRKLAALFFVPLLTYVGAMWAAQGSNRAITFSLPLGKLHFHDIIRLIVCPVFAERSVPMPSPIRAVIFDMDGVLIDSEPVYLGMQARNLQTKYPWVTLESMYPTVGMSSQEYPRFMARLCRVPFTPEFEKKLMQADENEPIHFPDILRPEARPMLEQLRAMGLQLALASSSPMSNIRQVLGECGLMEFFPVIVSGEQFEASKPDPEIYLHTMARLGRRPEECLIVEDSTYGVQAGAAAGGLVAALRDERFPFDQSAARFHIGNLSEIPALAASIQ